MKSAPFKMHSPITENEVLDLLKQYGEDALSKIREIIDLNPKYASLDEESKKSLVNNIIQEFETGQPPQDFLGAEKVSLKEIMGKRSEFDFKLKNSSFSLFFSANITVLVP